MFTDWCRVADYLEEDYRDLKAEFERVVAERDRAREALQEIDGHLEVDEPDEAQVIAREALVGLGEAR